MKQNVCNELKQKWIEHGKSWSAEKYSQKTGIKLRRVREFISKLRKGESIDLAKVRHGRPQKITQEIARTMVERIEEDNQVTLKEICTRVNERHGIQISTTTVSRFFASELYEEMGIAKYTFKRVSNREPTANSPEIKDLRKKRVLDQMNAIMAGYIPTFVDESSIQLSSVRNYGWAPKGEKALAYRKKGYLGLTAISFISTFGAEFTLLARGPVTREVFIATMRLFMNQQRHEGCNRVFIMDNASIHGGDLQTIIEEAGHKLVYNAPYSPEMNPIEMVCGFWKSGSAAILNKETSLRAVVKGLSESFMKIPPAQVLRSIEHVKYVLWPKIRDGKDL